MKIYHLIFIFLVLGSTGIYAQSSNENKKEWKSADWNLRRAEQLLYSNRDSAEIYAKRALQTGKELKDNKLKARAYLNLSNISHRNNDLPKSFEYVELAEIVASEIEDDDLLATANFQRGTLFMVIGNEEMAIELLGAAKKAFIKAKDSANLAVTLNSLSLMYKRSGNMDKAISTIKQSIKINRAVGRKHALAASLGNLSSYYTAKGDMESALTCIQETLKLFIEIQGHSEISRSLVYIGELYLLDKNYDSCMVYLDRAEEIIETHSLTDAWIDLWTVRGEYEMEMQQYSSALPLFKNAYEMSKEIGISELVKASLEKMYESAKKMGNTKLALDYLERFKTMSDSLEEISGKEALMSLELNQKFEHEQSLIEIERNELLIKEENDQLILTKKNYLIVNLILIGLLIIFIAFILIRKKQKTIGKKEDQKQVLNDELELRNKELVSSAIQILRKSEEMKQTISSLNELNERATPEDSQLLLSIIRKLKMELEHSSWEEFEVPFKQLHSRFYTNLIEKYPELTRAEIKVCSLLKLNLDTKQISSILHKTPASIEVDRSRIRKKMGLTNKKISLPRHINTNV